MSLVSQNPAQGSDCNKTACILLSQPYISYYACLQGYLEPPANFSIVQNQITFVISFILICIPKQFMVLIEMQTAQLDKDLITVIFE